MSKMLTSKTLEYDVVFTKTSILNRCPRFDLYPHPRVNSHSQPHRVSMIQKGNNVCYLDIDLEKKQQQHNFMDDLDFDL